jgi:hypothetical protein
MCMRECVRECVCVCAPLGVHACVCVCVCASSLRAYILNRAEIVFNVQLVITFIKGLYLKLQKINSTLTSPSWWGDNDCHRLRFRRPYES